MNKKTDIAVVSDRGTDKLKFFKIDSVYDRKNNAPLQEITAKNQCWIFASNIKQVNSGKTAYGLAVSRPYMDNRRAIAYVSQNDTTNIAQVIIDAAENGKVTYSVENVFALQERFTLSDGSQWRPFHDDENEMSHVEGMVIDNEHAVLYLAQEQVGIWKTDLFRPDHGWMLIDKVKQFGVPYNRIWNEKEEEYVPDFLWELDPKIGSDYLSEDVEGITIYDSGNGNGYLLASSQENSEFVLYNRKNHEHIGNFTVSDGTADGVQHCDGMHVVSAHLNDRYPHGLLVVQDGNNTPEVYDADNDVREQINFKFIDWNSLSKNMDLHSFKN